MELINSVHPDGLYEIIHIDISSDKKYCYCLIDNSKMIIIKDLYADSDKDKKQIIKANKELKEEKS